MQHPWTIAQRIMVIVAVWGLFGGMIALALRDGKPKLATMVGMSFVSVHVMLLQMARKLRRGPWAE